jgi:hypothetical protein
MGTIVAESMVRRAPAEGQPAEALLQEARDADLVVVGNRGHGGFRQPPAWLGQPPGRPPRALSRHRRPQRSVNATMRPWPLMFTAHAIRRPSIERPMGSALACWAVSCKGKGGSSP